MDGWKIFFKHTMPAEEVMYIDSKSGRCYSASGIAGTSTPFIRTKRSEQTGYCTDA